MKSYNQSVALQVRELCKLNNSSPSQELIWYAFLSKWNIGQSNETVEYTDCIFAEGLDYTNECPRYEIKLSDREAPITGALGEYLSIDIASRSKSTRTKTTDKVL